MINSRHDISPNSNDPNANDGMNHILSNVIETLPKEVQSISPSSSTNAINHDLDSVLSYILGRDNNENNDASNGTNTSSTINISHNPYQTYKNDTRLFDDTLSQKAIMLLLQMEDLSSTCDERNKGKYEIFAGDIASYLTMDRTAMECINLLPPSHAGISHVVVGGTNDTNSLFGVLNRCNTKMGSRLLEIWLRQPSVDLETILYRQNAVEYMVETNGLGRDQLRDEGLNGLKGVDLDGLCQKLTSHEDGCGGGTIKALESLYKLHLFADKQLPILMETLMDVVSSKRNSVEEEKKESNNSGDDDKRLGALESANAGLNQVFEELSKSVQLVEAVLDFDAAPREFLVKPSFSEELEELRTELNSVEHELQQIHDDMNQLWTDVTGESLGQVRLERDGKDSSCVWQFRLLDTNKEKTLRGEFKNELTVHRVLKNGVYFTNKDLRQLGSKKHDLMEDYDKHQRQIVQDAMSVAVTYVPVLERASQVIAELDVLASLAHVAAFSPYGYCKPQITDSDDDGYGVELKEARHPCVELQDNIDFIPNDFDLTYGSSSFLIVTGPNMGGKSTYIRSLGAIITMAQIGSYVPCTSAKINIIHHILARVGAGDVQDRGISTFMAEMLEASSILRTATKRSLIIVDELGRGTSTFDGYGLASAISEYIVQKIGCITVFATHFHELTSLEETEKVVKNCHVTARKATDGSNGLTFLYEVRPGPCLESFGIQVAEMANVPRSVVLDAKRKAKELETFDCNKRRKKEIVLRADDEASHENQNVLSALKLLNTFRNMPFGSMTTGEKCKAVTEIFA